MLVTIESHRTLRLARQALEAYVRAQQLVDSVYERIFREAVKVPAEETYFIEETGGLFNIVFSDPGEARDESSESLIDCGD